ncbi:RNA-directed DNA polymerase (Reverse transcriptase), partial [Trifolium medium]|nr:RNA-directed DNA polymerase (Reverse transcriptase) [Trifolium medium]
VNLYPLILAADDQHVTFSITENNKTYALSAIYAATRAHEHRGRSTPARLPMKEFQKWTDDSNLIHLPTIGAEFTWNNGRWGLRHTERRLDRAVCNQSWLDLWCPMFILNKKLKLVKEKLKTWNKTSFGNVHDLVNSTEQMLQHIQDQIQIFGPSNELLAEEKIAHEPLLADEVIPHLITDDINALMTLLPSHQEIKSAVFALNGDSAPGLDGFGAFFFQHYWEIIKQDVFNAVLEFFTSSWILPDRLAKVMLSIISEEQMGFIQGRNIKDCICIASEAANLLHNKSFGGNLALEIDISKAFDTLEWSFLLKVLKCFGFNDLFCNWIHVILKSAFLSISINGKSEGYFNCTRGVR